MRVLLLTSFSLLIAVTASSTSFACDCLTLPPAESFREADFVFEGEVLRIAKSADGTAYTFEVSRLLKGSHTNEVTVFQKNTDCDSEFSPDITYRVFAKKFAERLTSGVCFGNQILKVNSTFPATNFQNRSLWQLWYVKASLIVLASLLLSLVIWFWPIKTTQPLKRLQ